MLVLRGRQSSSPQVGFCFPASRSVILSFLISSLFCFKKNCGTFLHLLPTSLTQFSRLSVPPDPYPYQWTPSHANFAFANSTLCSFQSFFLAASILAATLAFFIDAFPFCSLSFPWAPYYFSSLSLSLLHFPVPILPS